MHFLIRIVSEKICFIKTPEHGVQYIPHPLQPSRERQACTFRHLQLSPLRGRDGYHSHVPQSGAARQLHRDI